MSGQPEDFRDNPYASPRNADHAHGSSRPGTPRPLLWLGFSILFGGIVGAGSRYVRPLISGPIHYESLVAGLLLVLFSAIVALRFSAAPRPVTVVTGLVVASWAAYATAWSVIHGSLWDDLMVAALTGAAVSSVLAMSTIATSRWIVRRGRRSVHSGSYRELP